MPDTFTPETLEEFNTEVEGYQEDPEFQVVDRYFYKDGSGDITFHNPWTLHTVTIVRKAF